MPTYNYPQPYPPQLYHPYSASLYPSTQMAPQTYQVQPQQQSSLLTVFVSSEEEVNMYPVAAGVTVLLISFNMRKFYLKATGKNGIPEPLRVFNFNEEDAQTAATLVNQNDGKYVGRDEFDALTKKLDDIVEKLGGA